MDSLPGSVLAGRYRVVRTLGQGGMGTVLEVVHDGLGERYALKLLHTEASRDAEALARFANAARIAARLRSEHLVRVTDTGQLPTGEPFLVMDYLEGTDLERVVEQGSVPIPTAVSWVLQACAGLAALHAEGLVHRDIKPSNLFLSRERDGRQVLKILDFGIAVSPAFTNKTALTEPGKVIGSIHYLAPEQLKREPVDARTDMWALAVILYRSVLGRRPFEGDGLVPLAAILREDPPPPSVVLPGVSPAVDSFFRRALCKDPDGRFPSLDDLVIAFEALAVGMAAPSLQAPRIPSDAPTRILAVGDGRREPGRWQIYAAAAVFPIVLVVLAFLAR